MSSRRDLLQESLVAIERLQARLAAAEQASHEPIAIIGAGCRYPGGIEDPEALWRLVRDGVDAVGEVPSDRWSAAQYFDSNRNAPGKMITTRGGFMRQVDQFDPQFFGISPREASTLDPQQRLLLETAYEALEAAGIAVDRLTGSRTGVFVGITTNDYGLLSRLGGLEHSDVYSATGNALNAASGRISFTFGFQGPCVSVDTACSSSLVAVHLACQSLRTRESNLALAGGVNVVLRPDAMILFSKWGMLAPDGACKTFDASADGFVRAEGCGMIALKRLTDAQADGDPILAVIKGSASNSDGRSSGLTVPNGPAQQAVIRQALVSARLAPDDIDYVEAHGTGTPLGDPIEVEALGAVLGPGHAADRPLLIGSIKTNLGHTEAASGLAGLLKVVKALQHEAIPPHLHFHHPNPGIPWGDFAIAVPTRLTPWPRGQRVRRAGVSSFGFSGTNAHVIVEEAPEPVEPAPGAGHHHVLPLSARNEAGLRAAADRWAQVLTDPSLAIGDICLTASTGRSHYTHRLAIVTDTISGAREALTAFARDGQAPGLVTGDHRAGVAPRIGFLFTGQGAQYPGMGLGLYDSEPVFRATLDLCAKALEGRLDRPLLEVLFATDGADNALSQTGFTQPALFALEVALAELWKSWGITPSVVLGHSVGEYAAACVAGAMSLEEGAALIAERARSMQALPAGGAMASIFADVDSVARVIATVAPELSIAAINGPAQVVASGSGESLDRLLSELDRSGIKSQRLNVSHAFHSRLLDPMLDDLEAAARRVTFRPSTIALISNLTGLPHDVDRSIDASYWRRHAREPVQFARSVQTAIEAGTNVFVEIGPTPTLISLASRIDGADRASWLPSLRKGRDDREQMLRAVAGLYTKGARIEWGAVERSGRRLAMPTYPFQRQRHWVTADVPSEPKRAARQRRGGHPLLGEPLDMASGAGVRIWEGTISLGSLPFLVDHKIQGRVIVPATAYLEMMVTAGENLFGPGSLALSDIKVHTPIALDPETVVETQTVLSATEDGAHRVTISSRPVGDDGRGGNWVLHATGLVSRDLQPEPNPIDLDAIRARCPDVVTGADFYRKLAIRGNDWGPSFRGLSQVWRGQHEAVARVEVPDSIRDGLDQFQFHPALADSGGHALAATISLEASNDRLGGAFVGGSLDKFIFHRRPRGELWSFARRRLGGARGNLLEGDITLVDETGTAVASVIGARLWYLDEHSDGQTRESLADRLYRVEWHDSAISEQPAPKSDPGRWLVLGDRTGLATALSGSAGDRRLVLIESADHFERIGPNHFRVDPGQPSQLSQALTAAGGEFNGALHLWSLDLSSAEQSALTDLDRSLDLAISSVVNLTAALAGRVGQRRTPVWLVTAGAQPVAGRAVSSATGGALWGLGRTLAVEQADWWGGLIDLDPGAAPMDAARGIWLHLDTSDRENQIAFRGDHRFAARLVRRPLSSATPVRLRRDGSYLITGGLGGLGLHVAKWMAERGASRLVLMGRSGLPPRAQWSSTDPATPVGRRIAAVRALERLGSTVEIAVVDVADGNQVRRYLEEFRQASWPPLRGVVHAAGTVHYGPLTQTTREHFADMFRAKVVGASWLDRLTTADPLDFFVLFSSASGILSSPLVGAYAAANGYLDSLAHRRRHDGLPALSIDWGLWSGAGMAEGADAEGLATITARGMGSLAPDQALEALEALLQGNDAQAAVIPVNWPAWQARYPMFVGSPFLREVLGSLASQSSVEQGGARAKLLELSPEDRQTEARRRIREHAAAVLQLHPSTIDGQEPLTALGIDSLMAVELKNRIDQDFGQGAPLVHFLDGSGLDRIAEVVLANFDASVGSPRSPSEDEALLAQLDHMSDQDVDALLKRLTEEETSS